MVMTSCSTNYAHKQVIRMIQRHLSSSIHIYERKEDPCDIHYHETELSNEINLSTIYLTLCF